MAERGISLSLLSRELGRNVAYLQQYVTRGSPKHLDPDDRLWLAKRFNVDERELGARDPWRPDDAGGDVSPVLKRTDD